MSAATESPEYPTRSDTDGTERVLLAWTVHRLRDEPERIPILAFAFAATIVIWWIVLPQVVLLPVPFLCLIAALNEFLFPVRFRLTTSGAHSDCGFSRLFIAWPDVKRMTRGRDGIYLSPFSRPSRLEAFRGVALRFAGNADMVTATVRNLYQHGDRLREG